MRLSGRDVYGWKGGWKAWAKFGDTTLRSLSEPDLLVLPLAALVGREDAELSWRGDPRNSLAEAKPLRNRVVATGSSTRTSAQP